MVKKANIIPNIDPGNPDEYLGALKKGVAHARGTSFPSQGRNIYLFSHSTNSPLNFSEYNAVFYLLRKLEKKDKIYCVYSSPLKALNNDIYVNLIEPLREIYELADKKNIKLQKIRVGLRTE